MAARPPSPPLLGKGGYFSSPFERFVRDDTFDQLASAFTLLGTRTRFLLYQHVAAHQCLSRHLRDLLRFTC